MLKELFSNLNKNIEKIAALPLNDEQQAADLRDMLITAIEENSVLYYDLDSPSLEDWQYDRLMNKLKEIERLYPSLALENSPTKKVGGSPSSVFKKVTHQVQMASLQDVFSKKELLEFDSKARETCLDIKYSVEPKIDGLSVSLFYENGILTVGSTRGDGFIGEDVTENLKTIKSIPKEIPCKIPLLEVRGEVYMPLESFKKAVEKQELRGEAPFKNPRNAAAGSLRQKDSAVTRERELSILIFNVQRIEGMEFSLHSKQLEFLKEQGFPVVPFFKADSIASAIEEIDRIGSERGSYPFDIDGAVIKADNLDERKALGSTAKYPKWAVAFKYPPEQKEAVILDIEVNVGRTGVLTPTAVFTPIFLSGTSVSRAVLHNQDFIDEKGIAIGDSVLVRKAGEIIPEIVSVTKKSQNPTYHLPESCPFCNSPVVREKDDAAIRCINLSCPAQLLRSIIHFASRNAMNIEGLGEALCETFLNEGLIKDASDIYKLQKSDIASLPKMGEKSAGNLISAIEKSKQNDLWQLIFGLGIRNIGQKAAKILAKTFESMDNIMYASIDELESIEGFGSIMSESVYSFFKNEKNLQLINELKESGVNMQNQQQSDANGNLSGLTFVITGTLPTLSREEASKMVESSGGKVSSSVSKKTSYLLAGEKAGSKLKKAQDAGIPVLTEQEFLKML